VKRTLLIITLFFTVCAASLAQTVTVTASHFGGTIPFTGIIFWQPTLANGTPASMQMSGGGQTTTQPFMAYVSNGVFTLNVPATDLTNPQNICFHVTALLKGVSMLGPGYLCVQPHYTATSTGDWCQAGVCNFDAYIPNIPALATEYNFAQVQTDWNATNGLAAILNKPTLGTASLANTTDFDAAGTASAEATRAEGAEALNAAAISTETNRAEGAEGLASNALGAETTRAEAAEATKEVAANKGVPNGYAALDSSGLVLSTEIPPMAIDQTWVVGSQALMLALSDAAKGDICIRTDLNETFVLTTNDASLLTNWVQILTPPSPVQSVNGMTGNVTTAAIPAASITNPSMDGTAATGSATTYARADHVHPTDTSRAADSAVVHTIGNESIAGNKTFTSGVAVASWTALPPSPSLSGWKLAGPLANTGSTSWVQVGSVTIPAGTLNATSHLDIKVELDACTTSSGVPTAACTGTANTGTCTYSVKFGTSNTGGTAIIASPGSLAASRTGVLLGVIEKTSASTQIGKATQISNSTYGGPPLQTTISTTGTTYLNFYVQNSVNTDTCFIDSASVTLFQ
jgi:hypothetical protein